jgi:hypothetical protein
MSRRTIAAVLLLALPAAAQGSDNSVYLGEFSCWGSLLPLKIDQNGAGLRKLGKVVSNRTRTHAFGATYREITFDGLVVTIYQGDRPMVAGVVVTKRNWNVVDGVRVGDSIQIVMQKVGKGAKAGRRFEVCGDGDCARFESVEGRITHIQYSCYTG